MLPVVLVSKLKSPTKLKGLQKLNLFLLQMACHIQQDSK